MTTQTNRNRNRTPYRARARGGGQWNSAYLTPYAWYDTNAGGSATEIADTSGNGRAAITNGAAGAAAKWLAYANPTVWFPTRATANFVSAPTSTSFNTTDLDFWIDLQLDDYSTGTNDWIAGRQSGADPNRQWDVRFSATGTLVLSWYPTGSAASVVTATTSTTIYTASGVVDGGRVAIRVTLDVDNGSSQYVATAYHRIGGYDGVWDTWQTFTGGATTTLPAVSSKLFVGGQGDLGYVVGRVYAASLAASIGGASVAYFDATNCTRTGYTDSQGNVWSVSRSTSGRKTFVQSVPASAARNSFLAATDDYMTGPTAAVPPCSNAANATMMVVVRPWATQSSGKVLFSTRSGSGAGVTLRMASATTIVADVSDGTTTNTTPAVTFTPGLRSVMGVVLSAAGTAYALVNTTTGSTVARPSGTQAAGALTLFADSTPANYIDTEIECAWLSLDRVVGDSELANLVVYYGAGA